MSLHAYLPFLVACIVVMVVPGPTVTLIVANSLRHGSRAGLLNVAGVQTGMVITVVVVLLGLASLIAAMGEWFMWVKLAGALYLIWLGWRLFTEPRDTAGAPAPRRSGTGFFMQGLAVDLSNPKTLLFFGAFFPQFMEPGRDFTAQMLIMGVTAMAVAALSDSAYALLASRLGASLSRRRARLLRWTGGSALVGGGLWLALSRSN